MRGHSDAPTREPVGGRVFGLWIGGQRIYDVTIYDAADRPVGAIGPDSMHTSQAYDDLQRVLVGEALQAGPAHEAV
jgi:YD repeat-containing protein